MSVSLTPSQIVDMYDTVMDLIDQRDTAKSEMAKAIHARFIAGQHVNHMNDHDFPEAFANHIVDLEAQIIDDPAYKLSLIHI